MGGENENARKRCRKEEESTDKDKLTVIMQRKQYENKISRER